MAAGQTPQTPEGVPAKPRWTAEQELAITTRGSDLLVAAAAGAGKTAVLVERAIRLVLGDDGDGGAASPPARRVGVDELLVVTFTEAAAAEMRERLAQALHQRLADLERDPGKAPAAELSRLRLQLALLGRASISTLHAFCLSVLRRYFHRLGLDPSFEVLSEEEAALLRAEVLDVVFEDLYDRGDPGFVGLVEAYGSERDDKPLREAVLRLHAFSRSHPDPEGWLDRAASAFGPPTGARLADLHFGRAVREDVALCFDMAIEGLRLAEVLSQRPGGPAGYGPTLAEDISRVTACARRARAGGWEDLTEALGEAAQFGSLPRSGKGESDPVLRKAARETRDAAKKVLRELADTFAGRSEEDLVAEIRALAPAMRALASLVSRFDLAYRQAKDARGTLDFSDLEHLCLRVLAAPAGERADRERPASGQAPSEAASSEAASLEAAPSEAAPSEAALEIRARYAEVLVDEYQDINEVQEQILRLVSRGDNLFMVGDVKQSIYRFRLADPFLFAAKYKAFTPVCKAFAPVRASVGPDGEDGPGGGSSPPAGRRVVLPHNFRSRRTVLDAVNFVFRQVMRADAAEIGYDEDSELRYGATFYGPSGETGPAVELHLIEGDVEAARREADGGGAGEAETGGAGTGAAWDSGAGPEGPNEQADRGLDDDNGEAAAAEGPSLEDLHTVEREARVMAQRVKEMVEGPSPLRVYDKRIKDYRPARYGDITVLMRATTGLANLVLETFTKLGVPAYARLSTGYFAATEVETVLSLLRVIDNPRQDIPLAAVLRSPVVGLDEESLARIRLADRAGEFHDAVLAAVAESGGKGTGAPCTVSPEVKERLTLFLDRLEAWRDAARRGPLSELIWRLYRETGLYAYVGGLPGGAQRQANLRGLYDRARLFDQFSRQGLARFLRFIDHLRESGGDLGPPQATGEGEDAVQIMSIHRSKGLEFPVVFLAHLGKKFNFDDAQGDLICHRTLGFGPTVADAARRLKYPSLANLAVARRNKHETVAEEMRCLYVAMTRARDCLVLVGTKHNLTRALMDWCLPNDQAARGGRLSAARVARATSYLDWIVPALASHPQAGLLRELGGYREEAGRPDPSLWDIKVWGLPGFPQVPFEPAQAPERAVEAWGWDLVARLEPLPDVGAGALTAALEWSYPARQLAELPAKVAPTELDRIARSGLEDDAASTVTAPGAAEAPPAEPFGSLAAIRPAFLQTAPAGPTPAEKGKATHLLLQHVDLSGPLDEEGLADLAGTLADREIMTPEQARAADVRAVARFFASDLGRWLVSARARVRREVPFTLGLPAGEVYDVTLSGETVLVQGIIDVVVDEPDGLTILDFKTDRVTAEEVPARAGTYRTQVALYRRAVETIWGRPVKTVYLYFLTPGVAVAVR